MALGAAMDQDREGTDGFDTWLAPFLAVMGCKTRRTWAPLYLRGLLGPGDRKSLQPMAVRLGLSGHDQLQHFIAARPGMTGRPGGNWPVRRIGWWTDPMPAW